jgi:RNA polymerase sigma-70 factor (ECF subfamily)
MTVFLGNRPLLDSFRDGSPHALRTVYLHYVDHVIMLLSSGFTEKSRGNYVQGVRDKEQKRELLQEIFIRAFSAKARLAYDGVRPYKSYLATIAGNLMIDTWRSNTRDPLSLLRREQLADIPQSELEAIADIEADGETEEEQLHWRRCLQESDRYVESLDSVSQEFVRLRFQEELPQEDAAQRLQLSRSKIRTMEKRILLELRKHLKKCGLVEG